MSVNGSCGYRRRYVLAAGLAALVAASGCSASSSESASLKGARALRPVLDSTRDLMASYEAAAKKEAAVSKSLEILRNNHSKHAKALAKILGEDGSETGKASAKTLEELREAESTAAAEAIEACATAPTELAVLLGEIAACRSTHHDVLGRL